MAQCLLDPGAGHDVLLPVPCWVSYAPIAELAGGRVVELPTSAENKFKITPEQLRRAITPRSRMLIINTPSGRRERGDDRLIRSAAVSHRIPCITTLAAAAATIQGLEAWLKKPLEVFALQDYHGALEA